MMVDRGPMHLNLFLDWHGYHPAGWRMDGAPLDPRDAQRIHLRMTQRAEQAKLDAVFYGDILELQGYAPGEPQGHKLEPFGVLSALAAATESIGLIGTASTTYLEPFNLARMMSTLDFISDGRAAWNIVTSFAGAANFNNKLVPHDARYQVADEYLQVVTALWDSWAVDAVVADQAGGSWADPDRIQRIDHVGENFQVQGPINLARMPQGWPVLVAAAASDAGLEFAAKYAEMVFTAAGDAMDRAQDFTRRMRERAQAAGRDPFSVRVMPGVQPVVASTEAEAKRIADELFERTSPRLAMQVLRGQMSFIDLAGLAFDKPIPDDRLPPPEEIQGDQGRYKMYYEWTKQGRTLGYLARAASQRRGHLYAVGTPEQVADEMERWYVNQACDGFQIQPPYLWDGFDAIIDQLIPELQRRGLAQTEYQGDTLRERLGLGATPQVGVRRT